jgi:hypothetical protein
MTGSASSDPHEEEFRDLLHFATLAQTEACLRRMDELWRRFKAEEMHAQAKRVVATARLGVQRARMIAGNKRVSPARRAEKEEIRQWFRVWIENPEVFFDWLELRKQAPEFVEKFGAPDSPAAAKEESENG